MGGTLPRIEIGATSKPGHVHRKTRKRRRRGWLYSLVGIFLVIGGAIYFVHADWQPDTDAKVASMSVAYRCPKCSNMFELTVAQAAQMRRERGDVVCPACGASGAEKQDVKVVVSGDDAPADSDSSEKPAGARGKVDDKTQPTMTRTLDKP